METETKTIRKIVLSINREMMTFLIVNRKIYYTDRKFGMLIRILPKPRNLLLTIAKTRNRVPKIIVNLFNFTKEEMEEYESAKDTDALTDIIVRDGKKNGCILVAKGDMEADSKLIDQIEKQEVVA